MEHQITNGPSYAILEATLSPGETLVSESGAMAWKDTHVVTETSTRGGVMQGLKRKLLSGESFFQNTWRAEGESGSIALAPGSAGVRATRPPGGRSSPTSSTASSTSRRAPSSPPARA